MNMGEGYIPENEKGSQIEIGPPFKIQYPMKNSIK
jgi:hypothetical protein